MQDKKTLDSGLPADMEIADSSVKKALARGAFRPVVTPMERDRERFELKMYPDGGGEPFTPRRRKPGTTFFYDPEISHLMTYDADDEILEFKIAVPNEGYSTDLDVQKDESVIYRGMSFEEFLAFCKTGEVRSHGDYNMQGQEGLTYWTTDPDSAVSYACAFAPMAYKPTFQRPAFVMSCCMPSEVRHVPGTGKHEVGVERAIKASEILRIWRGRVYEFDPGCIDLVPYGDVLRTAGSNAPRASVVWERVLPGLLDDIIRKLVSLEIICNDEVVNYAGMKK